MTLSLEQLWRDTQASIAARFSDLILPVAAFIFLPSLALTYLFEQPAAIGEWTWPYALASTAVGIIGTIGMLAVIVLVFYRDRSTAGAINDAFRLLPVGVVLSILYSLAVAAGLVLFIIPGLFLFGRLWLTLPAYVAERRAGAGLLDPMQTSFRITEGSVLKAVLLLVMIALAAFLLLLPVGAAAAIDIILGIGDPENGDAGVFTGIASALFNSVLYLYFAALQANAFVQLTGSTARGALS